MQRYASMRDAYDSNYTKAPDTTITEALDILLTSGIITEDEFNTLMKREETDFQKFKRHLDASNKDGKTIKSKPLTPEQEAQKAKNFAANRGNTFGGPDHSKRND